MYNSKERRETFKTIGALLVVIVGIILILFAIVKIVPPLLHAVSWEFSEDRGAAGASSLIQAASAPPIDSGQFHNDAEPRLTGYTYVFPTGTIDWKQVVSADVVNPNFNNATTIITVTYLCRMKSDIQYNKDAEIWHSCQPVVRKDE